QPHSNESPAPSSRSDSSVSSSPATLFQASLIRATTLPSSASSSLSSSRRGLTPSSEVTFNSSHQSGMSRSLSASAFQRSQRAHSKPVYARASSFVSDRRARAPHAGSPHQRSTSTSNTSRGNTIRLVMLNSVREVQNAECPSDELKTARLSSFIILHSALLFQPFNRPLPVHEFEVESRDAVGAEARGADDGDDREPGLHVRQAHEATALRLERRPDRRAVPADVLRHRLLARAHTSLFVEGLDADADGYLKSSLLRAHAALARVLYLAHRPETVLRRDRVHVVERRRVSDVARGRRLPREGHAHLEAYRRAARARLSARRDVADERPDAVLILYVVEA